MRLSLPLLMITAWTVAPLACAQTAAPERAASQPTALEPTAAEPGAAPPTATQTIPTQPTAPQQSAVQPTAAQATAVARGAARPAISARPSAAPPDTAAAVRRPGSAHRSSRHSRPQPGSGAAQGNAAARKADGVLSLGATDITGNKELPKVMVIVPWKDSLGAGGVIKPTDSLLDEVLGPVDRGVFQRRIRYYGQLKAAAEHPAASQVAPVGDSH